MGKLYGYVSGQLSGQQIHDQISSVVSFGVPEDCIMSEKVTKNGKQPVFSKLLKHLQPGDVLVLPSLGCLGESTSTMISNWKTLVQTKSVQVVILDFPMLSRYHPADSTRPLITELVPSLTAPLLITLRAVH